MKLQLLALPILVLSACDWLHLPADNPDPNHTHADFAIWLYEQKLDFSKPEFMSGLSTDETSHDEEDEHHHLHLHLHDGNGDIVHRHKPGLTFGEFLGSFGVTAKDGCFVYPDDGSLVPYPRFSGGEVCASYNYQWRFIVNGQDLSVEGDSDDFSKDVGATLDKAFAYAFNDGDKILLSLTDIKGSKEMAWKEWKQMTDEACLYSRTCPWRGDPPTENCIADPSVPCVEP